MITVHLDVDGVLADFTSGMLRTIEQVSGHRFGPEVVKTWEIFESISPLVPDEPDLKKRCEDKISTPGWVAELPVYPGAVEMMAVLRKVADVHIVTSPWHSSPYWHKERDEWIYRHFGIRPTDVTHTHRKYEVGDAGDIFIDDKSVHVERWIKRKQRHGYLWNRDYNQVTEMPLPRLYGWMDLLAAVDDHR
jgi:5'(3')-deoxyribonucleotidase